MNVFTKKEFDKKPIKLLIYIPDKLISNNDKSLYASLYKYLSDKPDFFLVDNVFMLENAITEKRSNIFALIREPVQNIEQIAQLSQIIYASEQVYNNHNLALYGMTIRYDSDSRKWIDDENCMKLFCDADGIVNSHKAVDNIFHHVKYDLMVYNKYICGFEACHI